MSAKGKKRQPTRFFEQYRGRLTIEQITEGSNSAVRNAVRLLADAKVLLGMGRFPSAAFLAAVAIEELGKLPILDLMASAEQSDLAARWTEYRSHLSKNARWLLPSLADSGPEPIEKFAAVLNPNSLHQQFFEEHKQLCLYTDCLEEGEWSEPREFAPKDTAEWIIQIADRLISDKRFAKAEIARRAAVWKRIAKASSQEEKKRIFAEHLCAGLGEASSEALLNGRLDLRGAGRK